MDFLYRIFLPLSHCCWRDGFHSLNSVKKGKSRPTLQGIHRSLVSEPSDYPRCFVTCVGDFMPIGDLENCLSKRHPAIYLITNPSSWFNCSSHHQPTKGVRKSDFSYTLSKTYECIWGWLGATVPVSVSIKREERLRVKHDPKNKGSWSQSKVLLSFAKAILVSL